MVGIIGGLIITFSSFHSSESNKGKTIPTSSENSQVGVVPVVGSAVPTQQSVTQPPIVTKQPDPTLVPPQINVNPQNLSFNNVLVNSTSSQQLNLANSGR
jgi:hypothetical protein